jgi:hypothetical protein
MRLSALFGKYGHLASNNPSRLLKNGLGLNSALFRILLPGAEV